MKAIFGVFSPNFGGGGTLNSVTRCCYHLSHGSPNAGYDIYLRINRPTSAPSWDLLPKACPDKTDDPDSYLTQALRDTNNLRNAQRRPFRGS